MNRSDYWNKLSLMTWDELRTELKRYDTHRDKYSSFIDGIESCISKYKTGVVGENGIKHSFIALSRLS